ncbi:DUF4124 domain-containing protein [Colwellia sp. RSH04]|uniref:DUF4124 domain-containing protein n=1 Tax=Colwellia sp. RSH04 TaxID=2305464 RepID=UPI000E57CDCE|nr:DUF4124 domain-containing protein [Colwellia sp. RSH04]RHW76167.1 DUF4124 domain-containing protein [Colwellia sp. RSH04]
MNKAILLLLLSPLSVYASDVYQCTVDGVTTFSQTPCDDQYNTVEVDNSSGGSISEEEKSMVMKACVNHHSSNFKDPNSVRIDNSKTVWISDTSGARQVLILDLNARNGYGAYEGAKPYRCFLNHDGSQLSKVQYLIQ